MQFLELLVRVCEFLVVQFCFRTILPIDRFPQCSGQLVVSSFWTCLFLVRKLFVGDKHCYRRVISYGVLDVISRYSVSRWTSVLYMRRGRPPGQTACHHWPLLNIRLNVSRNMALWVISSASMMQWCATYMTYVHAMQSDWMPSV